MLVRFSDSLFNSRLGIGVMQIIVIEDTKYMRTLLQDFLQSVGYRHIITAASAEEAFHILGISSGKHEGGVPLEVGCILMDIAMPGIDGIEACRKIKAVEYYKHVPVIMVTASKEISHLKQAFEAGAIDYIRKPVSDIELQARVNTVLNLKTQIDERLEKEANLKRLTDQLKESNVALEKLSFREPVTGLSNKFHIEQQIFIEWRRALRYKNPLSLMLIDVDHFDEYLKNNSESVANDAIKDISKQIKGTLKRPADLVARIGHGRFAILLPDTTYDGVSKVVEKLRSSVELMKMENLGSWKKEYLTLSLGSVTLIPTKKIKPPVLFENAKEALNQARVKGGNKGVNFKNENGRIVRPSKP